MKAEQLPRRIDQGTHMYTTLIRRAMENPKRAGLLPVFLETLPGPLWPGVVRAALQTPEQANYKAYRMVDAAMASVLSTGAHPEIVAEIYNVLPSETVALQQTTLEAAHQTVLIMENNGRISFYPVGYLQILNNYVGRLLQMCKIGEADTEGKKAVAFADDPSHSCLCGIDPARATAYENQALIMRELQRPAEALELLSKACRVYEELSVHEPEFKRKLAIGLNNHIAVLSALNRSEDAARLGRRAAALFREMNAGRKNIGGEFISHGLQAWIDNIQPHYATCLIALSTVLHAIKEYEESLGCAREAVEILLQLVEDAADFFPLLGQAQNNLAMALNGLDRFQEAEGAISEAVKTFRRLEALRPRMYTYYLAHCLRRQSFVLAQLDRLHEALPPCRESLRRYKQLEKYRPRAYTEELNGTQEQLEIITAEERKAVATSSRRRRGSVQ